MGRLLIAVALTCVLSLFLSALTMLNGYCGDGGDVGCEFSGTRQASFLIPGMLVVAILSLFGASALPPLRAVSRAVWIRGGAGVAGAAMASWALLVVWSVLEAKPEGPPTESLQLLWFASAAATLGSPLLGWAFAGASYRVARVLSYGAALSSVSWLLAVTWAMSETS